MAQPQRALFPSFLKKPLIYKAIYGIIERDEENDAQAHT